MDAVIVYDCPFSLHLYLLLVRNALYLQQSSNNLIPPFLLREVGLKVNECAKIHAIPHATEEHHSIFFPDENLRIPLKLSGIFSYFNHRKPHLDEINSLKVLFLTPDSANWDPRSPHFQEHESMFLDSSGSIVDKAPAKPLHLITDEDTVDNSTVYSLSIDAATYDEMVDNCIDSAKFYHFHHDTETTSVPVFETSLFSSKLQATVGSILLHLLQMTLISLPLLMKMVLCLTILLHPSHLYRVDHQINFPLHSCPKSGPLKSRKLKLQLTKILIFNGTQVTTLSLDSIQLMIVCYNTNE